MTAHLIISGYVQKVGYRQFVKKTALLLNLTGWVKNIPDRKVEVLASGQKEKLEKLITECKKGPFLAKVNDIKTNWLKEEKIFDEFSVLV